MEAIWRLERGTCGMKVKLTNTLIQKSPAKERRYALSDTEAQGLLVRIEPGGTKCFYVDYRNPRTGRRVSRRLGLTRELTVTQARELVQKIRVSVRNDGIDPTQMERDMRARLTLGEIVELYIPWLEIHRKSVRQTQIMLKSFSSLYQVIAEELSPTNITGWTQKHMHLSPRTLNRRVALIKGMLSWATRQGHIKKNSLQGKIEPVKEPDLGRVRFLAPDERERLLAALEERDREENDYLKTAVLVALNTGIRKGTLLRLRWEYVEWKGRTMTLPAQIMKGGKTKKVPLNVVAIDALSAWQERSAPQDPSSYIFPGDTPDGHLGDTKKPWRGLLKRAKIKNFRWHDMRHDFGSQLAMQGVDILTIKELMCHENLRMTLIYAHLAPQHVASAVEGLSRLYVSIPAPGGSVPGR